MTSNQLSPDNTPDSIAARSIELEQLPETDTGPFADRYGYGVCADSAFRPESQKFPRRDSQQNDGNAC